MQSKDLRLATEQDLENGIGAATAPLDQRLEDLEVSAGFTPGDINDTTNASLIRNQASETYSELSAAIGEQAVGKGELMVNVKDFGATGDGITDDHDAIQAAMDSLGESGGGTLLFSAGRTYYASDHVVLRSNITISGLGAKFKKKPGRASYSFFVSLSEGAHGYGSGASNIVFDGCTFEGQFEGGVTGICVTLHHSENITFRNCIFTESVASGHSIDLGGCRNVKIEQCIFEGWLASEGRSYTEAIQLDYSLAMGLGTETAPNAHDGLPTISVSIYDCKFKPLKIGSVTYPAPNALGNHSRVEGQWIEDIKFERNEIFGGRPNSDAPEGIEEYFQGWIHLFGVRNVSISGNTFTNTDSTKATNVINLRAPSTGTLLADVNNPSPTSQAIPVLPPTSIRITDNTFVNFNAPVFGPLMHVIGADSAYASGVSVTGTRFSGCTPGSGSEYTSTAQSGLYVRYADSLPITTTTVDGLGLLFKVVNAGDVLVSGVAGRNVSKSLSHFDDCDSVKLSDVSVTYAGGLYFRNLRSIKVSNAELRAFPGSTGRATVGAGLIVISGCKNIDVTNTTFNNVAANTFVTQAVWVYGDSQAGRIKDSTIVGSFTSGPFNISANSPTVVESGSITGVA